MEAVRIAVVGAGAFGKNHVRNLAEIEGAELVAVVDSDAERAQALATQYGCQPLTDFRQLYGTVDAAVVAAPTAVHAEIGSALLEAGIDTLIEKPLAPDLEAADRLIAAAESNQRILQVGHLERFNPVVEMAIEAATLPLFFEIHRLSQFSPRSLDVDVVLDLMIHDLDILLAMVDSEIERLEASGVPVLSEQPDIASVRIVFVNGCVANLTASRISTEKVRKLRFFQPRQYVSIDYGRKDGVAIGLDVDNRLQYRQLKPAAGEPLRAELEAFLSSVRTRQAPLVDGRASRRSLEAALRIRAEMERHAQVVRATVAAHRK